MGGKSSRMLKLREMVFQGIMLGPILRNLFHADVNRACAKFDFDEIMYADDLLCIFKDTSTKQ